MTDERIKELREQFSGMSNPVTDGIAGHQCLDEIERLRINADALLSLETIVASDIECSHIEIARDHDRWYVRYVGEGDLEVSSETLSSAIKLLTDKIRI